MSTKGENFKRCHEALIKLNNKYSGLNDQFETWFDADEFNDDDLVDEFTEGCEESMFIDYLKENDVIENDTQAQEIWDFLHKVFAKPEPPKPEPEKNPYHPTNYKFEDTPIYKIITTQISSKERKKWIESSSSPIKKSIKKQCDKLLPQSGIMRKSNQAQDLLSLLFLSHKNANYPLLLHLNDTIMRTYMNNWLRRGKPKGWVMRSKEFFERYCRNPNFIQMKNHGNTKKTIDFFQSAIDSYQKRILPCWKLAEPFYIIEENPLNFCRYMFEIARVVRNVANQSIHNHTTVMPIQLDFQIIHGKIKANKPKGKNCAGIDELFADDEDEEKGLNDYLNGDDDDDDESSSDDEEYDENTQLPQDIEAILKAKKIKYKAYDQPLRSLIRISDDLKELVDNKRSQRSVFIVDRRRSSGIDKDKLYLLRPNKYNNFDENPNNVIHASLHHNTIRSVLPRAKKKSNKSKDDYNARDGLRGQMLVISFHVISPEEIRCYLFYQGMCFRFYGEDLINMMPSFFREKEETAKLMIKKLKNEPAWRKSFTEFCNTFKDEKFDLFFHSLTNQHPRIPVLEK